MNLPISISTNSGELTMRSLEIADLVDKRHDNMLADIRKMLTELGLVTTDFSGVYQAGNKQQYINVVHARFTMAAKLLPQRGSIRF